MSKWSRIAVAVAVPLVLTVCSTPPSAVDGVPLPGDEVVSFVPAAAHREAEPQAPSPPSMIMAQRDTLGQPAVPQAGRVVDSAVPAAAHREAEPQAPSPPSMMMAQRDTLGQPAVPQAGRVVDSAVEPHSPLPPESVEARVAEPGAVMLAGAVSLIASEPPPPPAPTVVAAYSLTPAEPQPAGAFGPLRIESPTDADFDVVRVLIARSEELDADFYDPENLGAARTALRTAERIRSIDPGGAHVALSEAAARARVAFANSARLAAERLRFLLADRVEDLREIQADRWLSVDFAALIADGQFAERLYQAGDLFGAYRLVLETLQSMVDLRDSLVGRLEAVYQARVDTERYLEEAQEIDAQDWAADELKQLNVLYLGGLEAMQGYRLADAEEAFGAAAEAGRLLMRLAADRRDTTEMEHSAELLLLVMAEIEAASKLDVVTETGEWIQPDRWSGNLVLAALRAGTEQRGAVLDGIDFDSENPLVKAQEFWIEGVVEHDASNYGQAIQLFLTARRYIDVYKQYAVLDVYTVRLIPERRDCLWRIAEYDFIYGDPFLWPKIWRRNRELIRNPDLIHPGWQLIIPAL